MLVFGLVLIGIGIACYLIAMIAASILKPAGLLADDGGGVLGWLWGEIKKLLPNLTASGIAWYRRLVSFGSICLLVGLVLTGVGAAKDSGDSTTPDTTVAATTTT